VSEIHHAPKMIHSTHQCEYKSTQFSFKNLISFTINTSLDAYTTTSNSSSSTSFQDKPASLSTSEDFRHAAQINKPYAVLKKIAAREQAAVILLYHSSTTNLQPPPITHTTTFSQCALSTYGSSGGMIATAILTSSSVTSPRWE
jgi:hypothetical protein